MNKKKILAIVLVIVVLLLGGASIYVATQLSTNQAVAPNAPTSKPAAADCTSLTTLTACDAQTTPDCAWYAACNKCANSGTALSAVCPEWVGSTNCTVEATAVSVITPTATPTATPTEEIKATLTGSKSAYKNVTANTAGVYSLTTLMDTVSKSQTYVYAIELKNTGDATASGILIKDSLKGKPMTFLDTVAGCSWSATSEEITCNTSLKPNESKTLSYRVKTADSIVNGETVSNTAKVTFTGGSLDLTKSLTVSTVVSCNHTCTEDAECSSGLTCDTTTNKCRLATCATEDDCTCGVVTKTATAAATLTKVPTKVATAAATPSILPESGIFDLPGIMAFGGGLLLAIVGILLAL